MRRTFALMLLGALCITACNSSSNSEEALRNPDAKPVSLALDFSPEHGAAREITPRGGSIAATDANGTRYQLVIPEGALRVPQRISMIPIKSVKGLPLRGGAVAAVHLKPDGLLLYRPAVLRIHPRVNVPVPEQVGFAYSGNGQDAHMYSLGTDPRRIEMPILHFSGYGFGQAPPDDPGRKALQRAADLTAQLEARSAEIINQVRAKAIDAGGPETLEAALQALAGIHIEHYDQVIRPLMQRAEGDDRMAECAIQYYLGWARRVQLAGMAADVAEKAATPGNPEIDKRVKEGWASLLIIMKNAAQQGKERALRDCREQHDFTVMERIISLQRQMALLGMEEEGSLAKVWNEVMPCFSFELELRSVVELKSPTGGRHYHVAAKAPYHGLNGPDTVALPFQHFSASGNPKQDLFGNYGKGTAIEGILEGADGTISQAGSKPGRIVMEFPELKFRNDTIMQTTCGGTDERQQKQVTDTVLVTFSFQAPTELVRHSGAKIRTFTSEDFEWAQQFANRHGERRKFAEDADEDDIMSQTFTFKLAPVTPGVWRADFKTEEGVGERFSSKEHTYLILRHTPQ